LGKQEKFEWLGRARKKEGKIEENVDSLNVAAVSKKTVVVSFSKPHTIPSKMKSIVAQHW
jgi:hypothetical protein